MAEPMALAARSSVLLGNDSMLGVVPLVFVAAAFATGSLSVALLKHAKGPQYSLKRRVQLLFQVVAATLRAALGEAPRCLGGASRCRRQRVLVLGLDNAGKTTLCHALSHCRGYSWPWREPRPEHHVLHHHATWRSAELHLIDPCGEHGRHARKKSYALWEELLRGRIHGVLFVADAADGRRLPEAKDALHWLMCHPALREIPILVLGTKIDLGAAVDTWDLECRLGLAGLSRDQRAALLGSSLHNGGMPYELRHRIAGFHPNQAASPPHKGPLALRMCSLKRHGSVDAALEWLVAQLPTVVSPPPPQAEASAAAAANAEESPVAAVPLSAPAASATKPQSSQASRHPSKTWDVQGSLRVFRWLVQSGGGGSASARQAGLLPLYQA
mmetsp:Transcript_78572/g.204878  ORF Transcript_78572/g.204878 Transcript_78572/m.204878 type:complete len:386 (+) Transcript_78572:66-1223(+)